MRSWLNFLTRRVLSRLQRYNFALLVPLVCVFFVAICMIGLKFGKIMGLLGFSF